MVMYQIIQTSKLEFYNRIDAELYRSDYQKSLQTILNSGFKIRKISEFCKIRSGTTPADRVEGLKQGPILLKTTDIRNGILSRHNPYYHIPNFIHDRMLKTELKNNDVLLNIVGATLDVIGRTALLTKLNEKVNITQAMALLRISKPYFIPAFLFSFLCTSYAQDQVKRFARPTGQYNLNLSEIGKIVIPECPLVNQLEIENLVNKANSLLINAEETLIKAIKLLEEELGISGLEMTPYLGYITNFSELFKDNRADAEFFHRKYEPLILAATRYKNGWRPLKNMTFQNYTKLDSVSTTGEYNYIEIGDINITNGDYKVQIVKPEDLPANAKIILTGGEILVSQVRPTRGAITIIDNFVPPRTICSGAFYVCKSIDSQYREVIWLYLRLIKNVFEKYCGGTSYPTIESHYLANFPVPLFEESFVKKISELIISAKNENRESGRLLEEAKKRVERLIEEASKT